MNVSSILSGLDFNRALLIFIDVFSIWLIYKVYTNNPQNKINKLFTAMGSLFTLWINGGYFFAFSNNSDFSLLLGRVILGIVVWSFVLLYFLITNLSSEDKNSPLLDKFVIALGAVFSLIASLTRFIVMDVRSTQWGTDPVYSPYGKFFYYGFIALLMGLAVYQIIKQYARMNETQKKRVQFFFVGITVFISMNFVFNVFLPLIRNSIEYWQFGNYASIFLLGFTAYAITEHQLLNTKVIATEVVTLVIWSVYLSKLFISKFGPEMIIDLILFVVLVIFGVLLIKSVNREVAQRERLEDLNNKLKALDKQKDEFVSMAAHELRAPMTAIKGYISMVTEGDTGDIPEKARGFLADANAINERLIRLVNNMLNVSRIEEGRMVYQMERESLSQVVRSVYSQFIPEAERKGLKLELKIDPEIKDTVYADVDRIHEVVSNLMSNAVKYTDQGEVEVKLTQPNPGFVRCEVEDTGRGISEAEQGRLFNKFYRAETNVGKTIGTGLGLYICKLLIEKFNGKIGLKSQVGKGSTFWFELPVADGDIVNK